MRESMPHPQTAMQHRYDTPAWGGGKIIYYALSQTAPLTAASRRDEQRTYSVLLAGARLRAADSRVSAAAAFLRDCLPHAARCAADAAGTAFSGADAARLGDSVFPAA